MLLDLGFLELDVLARDWIVLPETQFFRLRARVLLGHVKKARVRAADELDLDCCRLGHWIDPDWKKEKAAAAASNRRVQ